MPAKRLVLVLSAGVLLCGVLLAAQRGSTTALPFVEGAGEPGGAAAAATLPAGSADAAVGAEYEHLLEGYSSALVRIKYVQKTQGAYGDYDGEREIIGVLISPTGLILCSNASFSASRGRYRSGRSVPTQIKVLVGDDTEGIDARFVARDTELDLAWLQVKPGDRRFTCVDLQTAEQPVLGQRLLTLGIMGKYFGEAVLVSEARVAGRTRKPRELYVHRGSLDTDTGSPVFTAAGKLVGFATDQRPDSDEVSGSMSAMTTRGWGMILPAETVAKATVRAEEVQSSEETAEPEGAAAATQSEPEGDSESEEGPADGE